MKKVLSLILMLVLMLSFTVLPVSAKEKKLTFDEDGKFRILQINDFQDRDTTNGDSLKFLNSVLDKYEPDLVVLVGDQLNERFPEVSTEKIKTAISNQVNPIEDRGIPFIFTFGNHDRDYNSIFSIDEQAAFYREFSCCYANADGADSGTYNTLIYGKDGTTPRLNIYMMDTHGIGEDKGVNAEQVSWYVNTSNALKDMNGGKVVPSLVFQHIPVKEMYKLLKFVPADTPGALKSKYYDGYHILDENAEWIGDRNVMRESPGCENPEKITGQYEAWLEQGDIIGAYFGHDHVNTFVGRTDDGIILGYNGGFGFAAYGDRGERYARIYDFNENDVEHYSQHTLYYTECVPPEAPEKPAVPEPEKPEEPEDSSKNCSCNCHKSGIMGFIWKIINFFNKLFKISKTCACGINHY